MQFVSNAFQKIINRFKGKSYYYASFNMFLVLLSQKKNRMMNFHCPFTKSFSLNFDDIFVRGNFLCNVFYF